jgi:ribonucleoside-triphosphate reductase (thioredoxin)
MREILSEFKLQTGYLKFDQKLGRKETWREAISNRIMWMHRTKYFEFADDPKFKEYVDFAEQAYIDKLVLGSQRALQFGGLPILRHNSKMYNCLTSYADRVPFFREAMWWLLSGCGVGFSVQYQHIDKLPSMKSRISGTKTFVAEDSIEGWADCIGVLLASYFGQGDDKFEEFYGYEIKFDLSKIRPKGAKISSGFKAPGPEPLKIALEKIEALIEKDLARYAMHDSNEMIVTPIQAYDIVMHASNAVLAGGVRRSATICIFSKDDIEMRSAKTGNWYVENPQRSRSNNSVALLKSETSIEEFEEIMQSVKEFGEPGFVWLDDLEILYNPCVEIGMVPKLRREAYTADGKDTPFYYWESGWQGCNLTEINGMACTTREKFLRACKASAILGTLQAGYTHFEYVGEVTQKIFEKEALLGCSITGWMNNPDILFDEELLREGAQLILDINAEFSALLGINPAARATCSKPSGNAAVILACASGMKAEESMNYIRYVQVNADEYGVEYFKELNPEMVERNVWDETGNGYTIGFAIENKGNPVLKKDLTGIAALEYVKTAMMSWIEAGTRSELSTIEVTRHNISNTITLGEDEWPDVVKYIYENRQWFAGISFMPMSGSLPYNQAPFSEVLSVSELLEKYGDGVLLASGLIVDGMHAFNDDLWKACMYVISKELKFEGTRSQVFFMKDWVRRAKKFAKNYFKNDLEKMTHALKDVHRFYRFNAIKKSYKKMDWENYREESDDIDIDTMGSAACTGNGCEIT